jgi:hypothetical protein
VSDERFLSRWARRKAQHRQQQGAGGSPADAAAQPVAGAPGAVVQPIETPSSGVGAAGEPAGPAPDTGTRAVSAPASAESAIEQVPPAPAPLPDPGSLTPDSDFTQFMRSGVDPQARNEALKRLFSDPHFNRMDGLDVYIDDYGRPDPIPAAMLRRLNQARSLRLFDEDENESEPAADAPPAAVGPQGATAGTAAGEMGSGAGPEAAPAPSADAVSDGAGASAPLDVGRAEGESAVPGGGPCRT